MTSLSLLANIAEILGLIFVLGGFVFAIIQIRIYRRQRLEASAIELLRSFHDAAFSKAFRVINKLPEDTSALALIQEDPEIEDAAAHIGTTMESIGVMVFRRIVPLAIVVDLMGGTVLHMWQKLEPWISKLRNEWESESVFEWFQWLTDKVETHPGNTTKKGAFDIYKDWVE